MGEHTALKAKREKEDLEDDFLAVKPFDIISWRGGDETSILCGKERPYRWFKE